MKSSREIAYGFIIFFLIDRLSRFISAQWAIKRNLSELETERMRCAIELVALFVGLVIFSPKEVAESVESAVTS